MLNPKLVFLAEFGLVFGVPLAFAFWQLHVLKKLDRQDEAKKTGDQD